MISISVKLKPSLLLGMLVLMMLLAVGWVIAHLALAQWGAVAWLVLPVLAIVQVLLLAWQLKPVFELYSIAISSAGQIVLVRGNADPVHVQLLTDSTLWPNCMILRFQDIATGRLYSVPVLPDSIGRVEFRALLVACRWLEARHGVLDREKILW
jgi:hypothetical protein